MMPAHSSGAASSSREDAGDGVGEVLADDARARRSRRRRASRCSATRAHRFSSPRRQNSHTPHVCAQPGDADAIADGEAAAVRTEPVDDADDLMAGDDRQPRRRQLAFDDVQVGATNGADVDAHADLLGAGIGFGRVDEPQGSRFDRALLLEA